MLNFVVNSSDVKRNSVERNIVAFNMLKAYRY